MDYLIIAGERGGAAGFHEGMKRAYEEGYDWIWVMDDDALPHADALEKLLAHREEAEVLIPNGLR